MRKKVLNQVVKAELLSATLVEITGLSEAAAQKIMDNANPKHAWIKKPVWNRWMCFYSDRQQKTFDVRISRVEYERLVNAELMIDFLQP